MPENLKYDVLYIRPWGSSSSYKEFPYKVDEVNTLPEHDVGMNDLDKDSYTNTKGKTVRHRARSNVCTLTFNVPHMYGNELHELIEMTRDVWLDCYFFYEDRWKFVSLKMYRDGTVSYHKYYVDSVDPNKNEYTNIKWGFVEE